MTKLRLMLDRAARLREQERRVRSMTDRECRQRLGTDRTTAMRDTQTALAKLRIKTHDLALRHVKIDTDAEETDTLLHLIAIDLLAVDRVQRIVQQLLFLCLCLNKEQSAQTKDYKCFIFHIFVCE